MTTFYDIDRANARLGELRSTLELLRDQRLDLIGLRDDLVAARGDGPDRAGTAEPDAVRVAEARIRALVDQMQASVARVDGWGITLRDIESGLVDFPALAAGRQVWLCWRLGEGDIAWWHELSDGFGARQPLAELV